jgi:hypothetical protein
VISELAAAPLETPPPATILRPNRQNGPAPHSRGRPKPPMPGRACIPGLFRMPGPPAGGARSAMARDSEADEASCRGGSACCSPGSHRGPVQGERRRSPQGPSVTKPCWLSHG